MDLTRGIICGLNAKLEFLLPFFYLNLRLNTDLPIVFFDYGLSPFGRQFCEKRGMVITLDDTLHHAETDQVRDLKRQFWFKKPLACARSPFDLSLWIDMDCMIREPIDSLFEYLKKDDWIAITQEFQIDVTEHKLHIKKIPIFNSGVFVFPKNSPILEKWIELCKTIDRTNIGDQDVLSFELFNHQDKMSQIDSRFNTLVDSNPGDDPYFSDLNIPLKLLPAFDGSKIPLCDVAILHFAGNAKSLFLSRHQYLETISHKELSVL